MLRPAGLPQSGKNIWKKKFFPGQGTFWMAWVILKGLAKSGNFKINGYGRQSPENSFILFKTGKDVLSHEIV